jgi:hypothetical protein
MCTRSYAQLRAMFDEYQKFQGHSIQDDLKKEYSGDVLKSFLAIGKKTTTIATTIKMTLWKAYLFYRNFFSV